ncbi:ATP-binding protein [Amycolatopsis nalaikhensis]|uniref:ATP-binding protein n=1 Tax=Amycolatopsis nalaikhensis TaxID=715472 RepID=A0ABY8XUH1_9PSEU|nr:ATP-binding protein [Amycolatopsis sp. 2-2]WIV59221.1 ATP-binding protein [Amycolatopsis sp. 2-2]
MPSSTSTDEPAGSGATDDSLRWVVTADPNQLARLRAQLVTWATGTGLDAEQVQDLQLAAYEAMANVAEHAYLGTTGILELHARSRGDRVIVTVADHGRWQPAPRPGLLHGRGLPLIRALAEQTVIETGDGTTVTMTWIRRP